MHLFEHDIIDNPFVLENKNDRVVICNELKPTTIQESRSPFDGSYTVISENNGTFSVSKRGYCLYGSLISFDEKSRLKSRIEGGNVIGTTHGFVYKGKLYQAIELWLTKNGKPVDIVQYLYKRDDTTVIKNEKSVDNHKGDIKVSETKEEAKLEKPNSKKTYTKKPVRKR